jgi:2'-5' RNA ligase
MPLDKDDSIRTFIAVELSAAVCEQIARMQNRLRREEASRIVRWVQPQNIHLTLHFLGDTPVGQLPEIEEALRAICSACEPFALQFGLLGCFPNVHNPRVLWIGVEEPSGNLARLHGQITRAMEPLGFKPEKRPFTPHLTLGRVKRHVSKRERQRLGDIIGSIQVPALPRTYVEAISFIRSQLRPSGPHYTTLFAADLTGKGR